MRVRARADCRKTNQIPKRFRNTLLKTVKEACVFKEITEIWISINNIK